MNMCANAYFDNESFFSPNSFEIMFSDTNSKLEPYLLIGFSYSKALLKENTFLSPEPYLSNYK